MSICASTAFCHRINKVANHEIILIIILALVRQTEDATKQGKAIAQGIRTEIDLHVAVYK